MKANNFVISLFLCSLCFISCGKKEGKVSGVNIMVDGMVYGWSPILTFEDLRLNTSDIEGEGYLLNVKIQYDHGLENSFEKDNKVIYRFPPYDGNCVIFNEKGDTLIKCTSSGPYGSHYDITTYAKLYTNYQGLSDNPQIIHFEGDVFEGEGDMVIDEGKMLGNKLSNGKPYHYITEYRIPVPKHLYGEPDHDGPGNYKLIRYTYYPDNPDRGLYDIPQEYYECFYGDGVYTTSQEAVIRRRYSKDGSLISNRNRYNSR